LAAGTVTGRAAVLMAGGQERFAEGASGTGVATAGAVTGRAAVLGLGGQARFGEGAPGTGVASAGTGLGEARTVAFGGGTGEPSGGVLPWRPQWKMRVDTARMRLPGGWLGTASGPDSTMVMISWVSRAWTW
jgi:hypothetical protein